MASIQRCGAEDGDRCRSQPGLAPVIPGLRRKTVDRVEAGRRIDRLGAGRREVPSEDRVEGLVHHLERLDSIPRALHQRRSVEKGDGHDEDPAADDGHEQPAPGRSRRSGRRQGSIGSVCAMSGLWRPRRRRTAAQPDGDGEADGHRRERAPAARRDRCPPRGQDEQSRRETDPERFAGRRVGAQQADESRDETPTSRQTAPINRPWPIDSHTVPSARVITELRKHPPDYTVGRPSVHWDPIVREREAPASRRRWRRGQRQARGCSGASRRHRCSRSRSP